MRDAQAALVEQAASRESLASAAAGIVQRNGEKLLEVGLDEAKACLCLCLDLYMVHEHILHPKSPILQPNSLRSVGFILIKAESTHSHANIPNLFVYSCGQQVHECIWQSYSSISARAPKLATLTLCAVADLLTPPTSQDWGRLGSIEVGREWHCYTDAADTGRQAPDVAAAVYVAHTRMF